jgi:hypothetical protein
MELFVCLGMILTIRDFLLSFGPLRNPILPHLVFTMMVSSITATASYEGIYSGPLFLDMYGSWNGTTFTITVNDTRPRFFHMIQSYGGNCSRLATWSTMFSLPANGDVLFALNPVISMMISANIECK